jgi:hypothetical protein
MKTRTLIANNRKQFEDELKNAFWVIASGSIIGTALGKVLF